jgi:hypothetical protein
MAAGQPEALVPGPDVTNKQVNKFLFSFPLHTGNFKSLAHFNITNVLLAMFCFYFGTNAD